VVTPTPTPTGATTPTPPPSGGGVAAACVLTLPATGKTYAFVPAISSASSGTSDSLAEVTIANGTTIAATHRARASRRYMYVRPLSRGFGRQHADFTVRSEVAVSPIITYTPAPAECAADAAHDTLYLESNGTDYGASPIVSIVSVNPTTAAFAFVTNFTTDATSSFTYSGGTFDISGITYDPNQSGVVIATDAGYETYSTVAPYAKLSQISGIPSENFGFNVTTDQFFSPQYLSSPSLDLADVKSGTYYKMSPPASPATPLPVADPDAGAVDSVTNIGISPEEFSVGTYIVGLNAAAFSGSGSSAAYSAPVNDFAMTGPLVSGIIDQTGAGLVSAAVDSPSHLAFLAGEFGPNGFCVLALPTTPGSLTPPTTVAPEGYKCATFPNTPDSATWQSPLDPHTTGTFELGGVPYGITFNAADSYIAIVNLQAMLAATPDPSDPGAVTSASELSSIVSYVQI
jgi:hypothetical protein